MLVLHFPLSILHCPLSISHCPLSISHCPLPSNLSLFTIAVIVAIGNDDVVEQAYVHELARMLESLCQLVVIATGTRIARWMVMGQSQCRVEFPQGYCQLGGKWHNSLRERGRAYAGTSDYKGPWKT